MKIKNKIIIVLFIFSLVFLSFGNISFAANDIEIYSPHCVLMELSTGKIIYSKGADDIVEPASTTKIMTALLTLENCELTDTATVSHEAIYTVPIGYSHAYLVEGEVLTIDQLLHVLLIPSANDAANVLAEHIAGSTSSFATMMNTRAKELGCENTNFVNANGIQHNEHVTTAKDLAIITKEAMKHETFRKIISTTSYTLPATNKYEEANRYFKNTNELILKDERDSIDNYYYPYATGVKTGYTAAAGECVVASAKKDDKEFIAVILGGERTDNGLSARFIDCKDLFEYAFENYKTSNITKADTVLKQVTISNAGFLNNKLDLICDSDITVVHKNTTNPSNITPTVEITSDLVAPIVKNSVIGKITYEVDGNTYTANLLASRDIKESSDMTTILTIISIILVLFFLFKLAKYKKRKKYRKNKNKNKEKDNYMFW